MECYDAMNSARDKFVMYLITVDRIVYILRFPLRNLFFNALTIFAVSCGEMAILL